MTIITPLWLFVIIIACSFGYYGLAIVLGMLLVLFMGMVGELP